MMSDVEEPPTKVLKMDVAPLSLDSTMDGQEEQEEWLSEGVLTDDDYLAGNVSQEQKPADDTMNLTQSPEPELHQPEIPELTTEESSIKMEQNIEDTLNNFEKTESGDSDKRDLFDELLKKEDKESDLDRSKHSDDDGHNTDDLLRMLGGEDNKKKKVLSSIREKNARYRGHRSSDDDDEYIFEGAKVTRLKVAKNALMRKPATKAEPEGLSDRDSDMSEDDVNTVKKMFTTKPRASGGARATPAQPFTSNVNTEKPKPLVRQYSNTGKNSLLKPQPREREETIDGEEFLEDDDFDLDDDMGSMSSLNSETRDAQLLRRPERMREEAPSDDDSRDEDSLYAVLPSSDSEDMDDWFTLDIRAERAGDYLPWLGDKAHKLLTEEKHRVTARLATLQQSVTALRSTERVQHDQIKVATEALNELDAMLAAA